MGVCTRYHRNEVPDAAWAEYYVRLLASGRERAAFYCLPRKSVAEFVHWVREYNGPWWLLTWKGEMAGCLYLSDFLGKRAHVHYAFLPLPEMRHEGGIPSPVALFRYAVAGAMHDTYQDDTPFMDTLIGVTPTWNKPSVKLAHRGGGVFLGEIPGACYCHDSTTNAAGAVFYFTRETVKPEWVKY